MKLETLEIPDIVKIDHKNGKFVHEKTGVEALEYTREERVIIGLVKQRRFWQTVEATEAFKLACSSNEGLIGKPTSSFPWGPETFSLQTGATEIKCAECPFNVPFGEYAPDRSHACGHQWLLVTSDSGGENVSILKLTGAAAKIAAAHLRPFQVKKQPAFVEGVYFNLLNAKRNGNRYSELVIDGTSATDSRAWVTKFLPLYKKWSEILETPSSPRASGPSGREGLRPLSM